jgi:hypothetical protein
MSKELQLGLVRLSERCGEGICTRNKTEHMVDMCSFVRMMSDYCQEMIKFWFSVETNHGMSWVCETCLLSCDVQVFSVETVDDNGEGQVSL